MTLHVVILAAGQGTRMHSKLPKVLHQLGGTSLLARVVAVAQQLNPSAIHVVIGHGSDNIKKTLSILPVNWVLQTEQLGTGHAVMQALEHIPDNATVLVLSADVPLITQTTLTALLQSHITKNLMLLVAKTPNPYGLGRVVRNSQAQICAIVEEKDATDIEKQINEIYSGICCAAATNFKRWLPNLRRDNAQKEYYLTEIIAMAVAEGTAVTALEVADNIEIQGVNNRLQLQHLEREWQKRIAQRLLYEGVTIADMERFDVRGELHCGVDVFIDVNNIFNGIVTLGDGCSIGPNCVLTNVTIGAHTTLLPNCVLEDCNIGAHNHIGPFARVRPGTKTAANCKIGNFVETKNAVFGADSKACHLTYLGDATIGKNVNIGAGTITCNYDGANKHKTIIEDGAFIGSDTQLVAPVKVGAEATIGAGTTLRKDAPAGALTLTVSQQKTVSGWIRPKKHSAETI